MKQASFVRELLQVKEGGEYTAAGYVSREWWLAARFERSIELVEAKEIVQEKKGRERKWRTSAFHSAVLYPFQNRMESGRHSKCAMVDEIAVWWVFNCYHDVHLVLPT